MFTRRQRAQAAGESDGAICDPAATHDTLRNGTQRVKFVCHRASWHAARGWQRSSLSNGELKSALRSSSLSFLPFLHLHRQALPPGYTLGRSLLLSQQLALLQFRATQQTCKDVWLDVPRWLQRYPAHARRLACAFCSFCGALGESLPFSIASALSSSVLTQLRRRHFSLAHRRPPAAFTSARLPPTRPTRSLSPSPSPRPSRRRRRRTRSSALRARPSPTRPPSFRSRRATSSTLIPTTMRKTSSTLACRPDRALSRSKSPSSTFGSSTPVSPRWILPKSARSAFA